MNEILIHIPCIGDVALTLSDIISLLGIAASLITSITAIAISVKTMLQNSKMIEESTRPYVSIYIGTTYFSSTITYLVMKNFGQSAATITKFSATPDLSFIAYDKEYVPYSHIVGTHICPGESLRFPVNVTNLPREIDPIRIEFEYTSKTNTYTENISINLAANFDMLHMRANTKDEHLQTISFTLQDISEKML